MMFQLLISLLWIRPLEAPGCILLCWAPIIKVLQSYVTVVMLYLALPPSIHALILHTPFLDMLLLVQRTKKCFLSCTLSCPSAFFHLLERKRIAIFVLSFLHNHCMSAFLIYDGMNTNSKALAPILLIIFYYIFYPLFYSWHLYSLIQSY